MMTDETIFLRWAKELPPEYIGTVICLVGVIGLIWWINQIQDPQRMERALGKKMEKQKVADIVSAALQDAAHQQQISPEVWHKYNKKLAYSLGLPDMIPKKEFILKRAVAEAKRRLVAMGVDHIAGVRNLRNGRTKDKNDILKKLKRKPS